MGVVSGFVFQLKNNGDVFNIFNSNASHQLMEFSIAILGVIENLNETKGKNILGVLFSNK